MASVGAVERVAGRGQLPFSLVEAEQQVDDRETDRRLLVSSIPLDRDRALHSPRDGAAQGISSGKAPSATPRIATMYVSPCQLPSPTFKPVWAWSIRT